MEQQRWRLPWGRIRMPFVGASALILVIASFTDGIVPRWLPLPLFVLAMAFYFVLGSPPAREPVAVTPPVVGRWRAVNSPADRVPSHGLHAYGQTFALDLVHEPDDGTRPPFGGVWPLARRPGDFPGFGQEVRAPTDGVVVRVHTRERDHWSRTSWPALLFLLLEGGVRELTGPARVLGNHVVIDIGGGVHAVLAHLQRGSVTVMPGEAVTAGTVLARCGNSGNSSEPHLHFQLMDHRRVLLADGVPFAFRSLTAADGDGVPRAAEPVVLNG